MKNRTGGIGIVIVVSLVVIALALSPRGVAQASDAAVVPYSGASPDSQTAPTPVYECYSVAEGQDVATVVRLVTKNFGADLVRVRNLVMMCEFAFKIPPPPAGIPDNTPPPSPTQTRIFACYRLDGGTDPADPYLLTTANFGTSAVQVRTSNLMCEEASKTRSLPGSVPPIQVTVGQPSGVVWQCYKLARSKSTGGPFRLITNNFGRDDVQIGGAVQMCEEAAKFRLDAAGNVIQSGEATGLVLECFRLGLGDTPNARVSLTTRNFGKDDVTVGLATRMCEPATKQPLFTLFPIPNEPRSSELEDAD